MLLAPSQGWRLADSELASPPERRLARPLESAPAGLGELLRFFDPLEPRRRPARHFGDPERQRGRVVLLGDAVLLDVAVEVGQVEGGVIAHFPEPRLAMCAPRVDSSSGRSRPSGSSFGTAAYQDRFDGEARSGFCLGRGRSTRLSYSSSAGSFGSSTVTSLLGGVAAGRGRASAERCGISVPNALAPRSPSRAPAGG
jgi:hypothetical protein